MSAKTNIKQILLFALILASAYSQCTSTSTSLPYIITGVMQIGVPNQSFAQAQYNVVFSGSGSLGTAANIFHAFAIAGFQTPGNQNFYSLSVEEVYFTNTNTAMTVFMNYANAANSVQTQWTKVKLTYLLVSQQFGGITNPSYFGNSYVWAGQVQITSPKINQPVQNDPIYSHLNAAGICGYVDSFPPVYGTNCPADAKIIYHYYVMGFQYDSSTDSSFEIRFSVRGGAGTDNNEANLNMLIQSGITPNGAYMTVPNFNGNLDMVKVSMVLVVIRDYASYPTQGSNPQNFKYSGIFMPLSTFNSPVSVSKGTQTNINFFDITTAKFKFYGFSSLSIASSSGPVDVSLDLPSLYTLQFTSTNPISNLIISGDLFNSDVGLTCSPNPIQMTNVLSEQYSAVPFLNSLQQTLNRISSSNGIIPGYSNEYVFNMAGNSNGNTDILNFYMNITYGQLTAGKTYRISVAFDELSASGLPNGQKYVYSVQVNGQTVFINTITTTSALDNVINNIGLNVDTTTLVVTVSVSFARSSAVNQNLRINLVLLQFDVIYDATNGCCAFRCPIQTGINLNSNPPSCVDCNSLAGLYFDSNSNQCKCLSGYYEVSGNSQNCAPCTASLCSACRPDGPSRCLTCVVGATLNTFLQTCTCNSGSVQFNNTCTSCSYKCASCSVSNQCNTCADSTRRDILNSCNCIDGFYDNGSPNCVACSSNCRTCASPTTCTSCRPNTNRSLDANNLCSCSNGFFSTIDVNNNSVCSPCSPQCTQCTGNSFTCTFCNATLNLVPGNDNAGRLTCVCASGYSLNAGGSCVQSSCTNDPLCSQCQVQPGGISICVQCSDSLNRVLQTPQYNCICKPGFYQNSNKLCVSCADGCATCNASTICQACVPFATFLSNQTCQCPTGSFFTTDPTRFCKSCDSNCAACSSSGACLSCVNGFNRTLDGKCVCGAGMYISGNQCLACRAGCQTCTDINTCTVCISPLTLQNGSCVQRCDMGFYRSGSLCLTCNSGCSFCQQANICIVCNNGLFIFSGKCYSNCPSGTVTQTTNGTCVPCNAPCRTCNVHPSRCTSCVSNSGFLYNGQCTTQCIRGTFALDGVCQICDFSCAQCLGRSTTCTACPTGRVLFNGACFNNCPFPDANGGCSTVCPVGFYQSSASSCSQCDQSCLSCSQSPTQCSTCASNRLFYQGACLTACPSNTYGTTSRTCQACDSSCNQCSGSRLQCVACRSGFSLQGSQCIPNQNCTIRQFFNFTVGQCRQCDNICQTCSAQSYCTSCYNNQVPVNGVCPAINCPANCLNCSSITVCTSCAQGYYLQNITCVLACSFPYSPINGVCQCGFGFFFNNSCVQSCPSGYVAISKDCLPCDPSCLQCSQKINFCTSCQTGFNFNSATNTCQISSANCPYGQYDQSGFCYRNCAPNSFYQGGFCFFSCSSGFQDNGFGGCVAISNNTTNNTNNSTRCASNLFNNSGQCVNSCPTGRYPDSNRVCQLCNLNCTTCQTSTICTACQSGYNLNNGSCLLNGSCPSNQLRYNGTCVDACPVGNIASQGNCQRICTTGQFFYNTRCYLPCPTTLRTADACVDVCPSGYSKTLINSENICVPANSTTVTCSFGYYYNQTQGNCVQCTSPCQSCQDGSTCFTCLSGYSLLINQCVSLFSDCTAGFYKDSSRSCFKCPAKCQTCSSSTVCLTCPSGFVLNSIGDCIIQNNPSNLPQFTGINVQASYLRGNSLIVTLVMSAMPTSLSTSQVNQFFSVLASSGINTIVSVVQWQDPNFANRIFVMVNFQNINGSSFIFLSIKARIMGNLYAGLGFRINESNYKAVSVFQTLAPAPSTIQPPLNIQAIIYSRTDNLPST